MGRARRRWRRRGLRHEPLQDGPQGARAVELELVGGPVEQPLEERAFAGDEPGDSLFDAGTADQVVDVDWSLLAQAVDSPPFVAPARLGSMGARG